MCLDAVAKKSKDVYNAWVRKKRTFVWGYKLVNVQNQELRSLWHHNYIWKAGINKSNSLSNVFPNKKFGKQAFSSLIQVNRGIHVYMTRAKAIHDLTYHEQGSILIKVKCPVDQFIGCNCQANLGVFKQVELPQSEYDKALRYHISPA